VPAVVIRPIHTDHPQRRAIHHIRITAVDNALRYRPLRRWRLRHPVVAFHTCRDLDLQLCVSGACSAGRCRLCNADMVDCAVGDGLYGSAEITTAGTGNASISKIFGMVINNIKAVFHNIPGVDAGSTLRQAP